MASNSKPLAEGTVIMADHQYAGRGQQTSVWVTAPGKNISTSIYLRPTFLPLNKQFYLNMAVSIAVCEALSTFISNGIKLKWPNDIYYNKKKLGGILIENTLTGVSLKSAVIGIGLNINQEDFPSELSEKATSVIQILHKEVVLNDIMEKIFVFMEKYYLILKSGKYDILQKDYLKRLYNFNILAPYQRSGEIFEGIIKGVEEDGRLIVETRAGIQVFNFKEIEFIHTQ